MKTVFVTVLDAAVTLVVLYIAVVVLGNLSSYDKIAAMGAIGFLVLASCSVLSFRDRMKRRVKFTVGADEVPLNYRGEWVSPDGETKLTVDAGGMVWRGSRWGWLGKHGKGIRFGGMGGSLTAARLKKHGTRLQFGYWDPAGVWQDAGVEFTKVD